MTHDTLLAIAADWSHWTSAPPSSVPRVLHGEPPWSDRLACVIQGVRRCGKSTLMRQLAQRWDLNPLDCLFVNFEDPRLALDLRWETLQELTTAFRGRRPDAPRRTFFLDEIQNVSGWERWLRSRLDRPSGEAFVLTGSNASLLSGELGSSLTGRHLTIELTPFSWAERRQLEPDLSLESFLHSGGFPEPLTLPEPDMLLRQYFLDIVERDVRERVGSRSSLPIRQLVQLAYASAGSELSVRRAAAAVGVSVDTAGAYLAAAEDAYLVHQVPFFSWSEAQRVRRHRKLYPVDTGLRRAVVRPGTLDRGKALECATLIALRRTHRDIAYWRDDESEVDFVLRDGSRTIPVQVSWDGPKDPHFRALDAFWRAFPTAEEALFVSAESFDGL